VSSNRSSAPEKARLICQQKGNLVHIEKASGHQGAYGARTFKNITGEAVLIEGTAHKQAKNLLGWRQGGEEHVWCGQKNHEPKSRGCEEEIKKERLKAVLAPGDENGRERGRRAHRTKGGRQFICRKYPEIRPTG